MASLFLSARKPRRGLRAGCTGRNSTAARLRANKPRGSLLELNAFIGDASREKIRALRLSPPTSQRHCPTRTRRRCVRGRRGEVASKGLRRRVRSRRTGSRGLHAIPSTLRHTRRFSGDSHGESTSTPRNFAGRFQQVISRRFTLIAVISDISQLAMILLFTVYRTPSGECSICLLCSRLVH